MSEEIPVSSDLGSRRPSRRKAVVKNYDENLMDDLIEKQLGGSPKKKKKIKTKKDLEKETEIEAMIALSLGFPIDKLLEEEIEAGVVKELGGKEQNDYIVVRNHILVKWRENVQVWLSKGKIRETVSSEYEQLMSSAYDFLLINGYINFGVSPSFDSQTPEDSSKGSVIIVGAGFAGLAAAKQLMSFGFKVVVLEARNRPGGRVYTQKMVGQDGKVASVDLGGSVITGIHANPLGVLARQLSIPLHKVRDKCPLYRPDGVLVDPKIDSKVEHIFNKLLDYATQLREIIGGLANNMSLGSVLEKLKQLYPVGTSLEERQLLDWHFANLEYANAGCLSQLSAAYWDQDDPYEMGGDHCFLSGGNASLIRGLCKGVAIFFGKIVETIRYGDEGVEILVGDQVFKADMVLCTVPLGVLKKRKIKFEPELPAKKLEAIERLGFGLLNKVAMIFPYVFWGEELDTFGCLSEHTQKRGEFFLFYSYHTVSGGPVLIALVAGEAAQAFEHRDPSSSLHHVLCILKGIYGPKGIHVPDPIQSICTRWGNDPFTYGSYSHVRVQSSGNDYDLLAESVGNRLFFAGEATTRQYPATMHGAYLSGLREASRILKTIRAAPQLHQKKSIPKSVGYSKDALVDLFKRPDLEVEEFKFVFDPLDDNPESIGLMQYSLVKLNDEVRDGSSDQKEMEVSNPNLADQPLQLYSVLSRQQAHELLQVTGGKEKILSHAVKTLGLNIMGAYGLAMQASSLIANISRSRKGKGRGRPPRNTLAHVS